MDGDQDAAPPEDGFAAQRPLRDAAEKHDDLWIHTLELAQEKRLACRDLLPARRPVAWRCVLFHRRDEDLTPWETDFSQRAIEELPGLSNEWSSCPLLLGSRGLADDEDARMAGSLPEHRTTASARQRTCHHVGLRDTGVTA
jgi:hypothetical protein